MKSHGNYVATKSHKKPQKGWFVFVRFRDFSWPLLGFRAFGPLGSTGPTFRATDMVGRIVPNLPGLFFLDLNPFGRPDGPLGATAPTSAEENYD